MGIKTKIEYCDSTINPTPTCSGCELYNNEEPAENHCYAAALVRRWGGKKGWPRSFTEFELFEGRIERACSWPDLTGQRRPEKPWLNGFLRIVFLKDLGDSFSPIAPSNWLTPYVPMMEDAHIWLLLTKWPLRMYRFFEKLGRVPTNFWLGTTVTSEKTAFRLDDLAQIKEIQRDARLWVSMEPLLGPVDPCRFSCEACGGKGQFDYPTWRGSETSAKRGCVRCGGNGTPFDWIDVGGESGFNARPMHPDWARSIRDLCQSSGVAYSMKQWGEWLHESQVQEEHIERARSSRRMEAGDGFQYIRVGKKSAGRLLDGRTWDQLPEVNR